jgi:hypothetical protein
LARFQVTFKGPLHDVTVAGDSAEEVLREYQLFSSALDKLLGKGKSLGSAQILHSMQTVDSRPRPSQREFKTLDELSIPNEIKHRLVEQRKNLSNWDTMFLLLHYAPDGLTNRELRSLSEELGKPISYSWFDTEFHRRKKEGFVVARQVPSMREKAYFLAEPGKVQAQKLIHDLAKDVKDR